MQNVDADSKMKNSKFRSKAFERSTQTFSSFRSKNEFVPFEQQRDHLGRLITENKIKSKSNLSIKQKQETSKYGINSKISDEITNNAIEKMFRYTHISQRNSSKDKKKRRVISSTATPYHPPEVGYYDSAEITDKMKYKKAREVTFGKLQKSTNVQSSRIKQSRSSKAITYNQIRTQPSRKTEVQKNKNNHASTLNFNLPQLQKYQQMKKLKLTFYQNFQENHAKFKELAKSTLSLARRIKINLQLV